MADNFNMNMIYFEQNEKLQKCVNITFGHSVIPIINKPTGLAMKKETAINHIFPNFITTTRFKTIVIKWNILDHFLRFILAATKFIWKRQRNAAYLGTTIMIFPWKNSNKSCILLIQTLLIRIIQTLLIFFVALSKLFSLLPTHPRQIKSYYVFGKKIFLQRYAEIYRHLPSKSFKNAALGRQEIVQCKCFFLH